MNEKPIPVNRIVASLAAWLLALIGAVAGSAEPLQVENPLDPDEGLTVVQRQVSVVALPSSDLRVDLWIDRPDGVYGEGESMKIFVRPSESAYVTVFNVNARGETTVVYPNKYRAQNFVRGNRVLSVPGAEAKFDLRLSRPFGSNLIKVLATKEPVSLLDASRVVQGGVFRSVQGGAAALSRQIQVTAKERPRAGWGAAQLSFSVAASAATPGPSVSVLPVQPTASGVPALDALLAAPGGFGLQMDLSRSSYEAGEGLSLTVVAERDCDLTLVNVDERGRATVLVPNRIEPKRSLKAGVVQFLPGSQSRLQYRVQGEGRQALAGFCLDVKRPDKPDKPGGFWSQLFGGGREKGRSASRAAVAVLGETDLETMLAELGRQPAELVARSAAGYQVRRAR